jgi:hypothetical protein
MSATDLVPSRCLVAINWALSTATPFFPFLARTRPSFAHRRAAPSPFKLARPNVKDEATVLHPYDAELESETRYTNVLMTPEFREEASPLWALLGQCWHTRRPESHSPSCAGAKGENWITKTPLERALGSTLVSPLWNASRHQSPPCHPSCPFIDEWLRLDSVYPFILFKSKP